MIARFPFNACHPFNAFRHLVLVVGCMAWTGGLGGSLCQADWPGLLGTHRDGHASPGARIPERVPAELKPVWELKAGQGYAGAAIRDGQVALFQREGSEDVLQWVSVANGKVLWRVTFPAKYQRGIDSDTGPRSVPQILEDCVLVHAASGALHCVSRSDGKPRWSRDLRKEYGAEEGYFGAGNSPLVVGSTVIVNVGGKKKNAGVVALSLQDGKTLWQATDADAGYASPIVVRGQGATGSPLVTAVVPTRLTTFGLDVRSGNVLWEFPFGQRGPTVNAATPIVTSSGNLFQTSSYGIGCVTAAMGSGSVKLMFQGDALSSQYATPVAIADHVYGSDGREDAGLASFKCVHAETGEVKWNEPGMPICHTIAFGEGEAARLLLVGIDGQLWLCPARPDGFQAIWKSRLPTGKYRALPAWSDQRLIVRQCGAADAKWLCIEL